ncbi:MAG: hypothetical protein J2P19_01825 [Pseudonocardia sp.]|nr:hypothetical protein [Pseudonocardia sp.]
MSSLTGTGEAIGLHNAVAKLDAQVTAALKFKEYNETVLATFQEHEVTGEARQSIVDADEQIDYAINGLRTSQQGLRRSQVGADQWAAKGWQGDDQFLDRQVRSS